MGKRFIEVAATTILAFALVVPAMAAEDPFMGTWWATSQWTLSPNGDGFSIQRNGGMLHIGSYGKDFLSEDGYTANIVRVDDHTLARTNLRDGIFHSQETNIVSPDGKHFTRIVEFANFSNKITVEYERIGSVPTGDAFFGTWRKRSLMTTLTITIDSRTFNTAENSAHTINAFKLNGNESKGSLGETYRAKRIDARTIEVIRKLPQNFEQTSLWQVQGDTLLVTSTVTAPDKEPLKSVSSYERMK